MRGAALLVGGLLLAGAAAALGPQNTVLGRQVAPRADAPAVATT